MSRGFFILGTDTGVGKTVVTAGLAMGLRSRGYSIGVMKPVASGCMEIGNSLISEDAVFLLEAAHNEFTALSNPIRYKEPLAPSVAAEIEGRPVDVGKIFFAYRELKRHYAIILVEGVGGLLVPLTEHYLISDLVHDLKTPVIIVGRIGLGTINHTLLTIEAARARGFTVAGVILNGLDPQSAGIAEATNPRVIEKIADIKLLGVLPKIDMLSVEGCMYGNLADEIEKTIDIDILLEGYPTAGGKG